ncbi:MAG: nucleotidyl transferase AbiEii/AbiGii toxin family protein [Vicinamibacteria bacterium]|nr:nucleotidyl transferase AbiEii/AbiGii toxin family protein [Vicinamibacteria bacterium]
MPLTKFQEALARLLATNRTPDSYLAGGAALHIEPDSKRYSNDLDYFQDSEARVASAFEDDRKLLAARGYELEILLRQPGFVRALARRGGDATKIEWAHDSAWRFLPPVKSPRAGFVLHPVDLAVNKLLALVGRDEPRDYVDIHEAMASILPLGALCWAASSKDPGYTPALLLDLLRRRGRYRPEDFTRLALTSPVDLPALKRRWIEALEGAERFLASRDPDEVGCLYYSPDEGRFVEPVPGQRVSPHFGRPGGVLPVVVG